MGELYFGINLEFVRHHDKPFEWGVQKAAHLGYTHVEPMVHWGRELLSEAGYFHSISMLDDPLRIKRACDKAGVIDWGAVIGLCRKAKGDIVLSVECGTVEQAQRSIEHLQSLASG